MPLLPPHILQPIQSLSLATLNSINPKAAAHSPERKEKYTPIVDDHLYNLKCSVCPFYEPKVKILSPQLKVDISQPLLSAISLLLFRPLKSESKILT